MWLREISATEGVTQHLNEVKSNLSGYGSNSLGNLFKISDKEIYENQQKKYNIVTMNPKPYNQSIKMFPKLRN